MPTPRVGKAIHGRAEAGSVRGAACFFLLAIGLSGCTVPTATLAPAHAASIVEPLRASISFDAGDWFVAYLASFSNADRSSDGFFEIETNVTGNATYVESAWYGADATQLQPLGTFGSEGPIGHGTGYAGLGPDDPGTTLVVCVIHAAQPSSLQVAIVHRENLTVLSSRPVRLLAHGAADLSYDFEFLAPQGGFAHTYRTQVERSPLDPIAIAPAWTISTHHGSNATNLEIADFGTAAPFDIGVGRLESSWTANGKTTPANTVFVDAEAPVPTGTGFAATEVNTHDSQVAARITGLLSASLLITDHASVPLDLNRLGYTLDPSFQNFGFQVSIGRVTTFCHSVPTMVCSSTRAP